MLGLARSCFVGVIALVVGGCAGAQSPPAVAKGEAKTMVESPPPDLVPSTRRDRRSEAGVRAKATPLVLGKDKDVACGKLPGAIRSNAGSASTEEMLAGRMSIVVGAGFVKESTAASGDGPTKEEESRVVLDDRHGLGMAIVAKEMFQLDPDLYEPEADAPTKPGTLDVEAAKYLKATLPDETSLEISPVEIDGMRAYAARPKEPSAPRGKDTALVLALLIARDDGTLQTITFHVRDLKGERVRNAMGSTLVGCTRLAERYAAMVTKGQRELERDAGTRTIASANGDGDLVVRVPRDYVTVPTANGARVYKLRPLSLYAGSITIALGDDPSKKTAPADADVSVDGKLLGRGTQWRGKNNPRGGGFLFAAESIDDKRFAGVLVKATRQAKVLDEMRSVAETLTLVPRKK